jgi:hypothetical protein
MRRRPDNKCFIVPKSYDETPEMNDEGEDIYGNSQEMSLEQRLQNIKEFKELRLIKL